MQWAQAYSALSTPKVIICYCEDEGVHPLVDVKGPERDGRGCNRRCHGALAPELWAGASLWAESAGGRPAGSKRLRPYLTAVCRGAEFSPCLMVLPL